MAKAELTVILPKMASLVQQEINQNIFPETLKKVLNKASFIPDETTLERSLLNHFSDDISTHTDLPLAALRSEDKNVICADPCYLHPDRDQLLLFSDSLQITSEEADELITVIQPLLTDFGAVLTKHNNDQWVISLESMPELDFTALPEVTNKAVQHYLPTGDEQTRLAWLRLWNEIQMLLFDLPLNEKRQQQGKLPINSLWFWGKGMINVKPHAWQQVVGNNTLLQTLAERTNVAHQINIDEAKMSLIIGKRLIVFEPLDLEGQWQEQLDNVEQVLVKLWQKLKWKKLAKVTIEIPNFGNYQLTTFDCWKPWS